jgi:hypothetical protein
MLNMANKKDWFSIELTAFRFMLNVVGINDLLTEKSLL